MSSSSSPQLTIVHPLLIRIILPQRPLRILKLPLRLADILLAPIQGFLARGVLLGAEVLDLLARVADLVKA